MYTKKAAYGSLIILVLDVDDMLIVCRDTYVLDSLHDSFDMKYLDDANHILMKRRLK